MEMQVSVSHFKEEQTTFASGPVHAVIAEQAITEPVCFQAVALAPGHPLHLLLHCVHAHGKALEFHASAPCLRMVGSACTRRWGALAGWGIHPGANSLSALSSPKC